MEFDEKLLQNVKRLLLTRYPRFGTQIANITLEYRTDLQSHSAGTDGTKIYFDPGYLTSLSDEDKTFLIAHELMHIKFEHMYRLTDKNGQKRDLETWNIATDAIINANLQRDGFRIIDGGVNITEALNYTAEELYEKLLQEKQKQNGDQTGPGNNDQNQNQNDQQKPGQSDHNDQNRSQRQNNRNQISNNQNQQRQNNDNQNQDQNSPQNGNQNRQNTNNNQRFNDDHSLWEKAMEKRQNDCERQDKQSAENSDRTDTSQNVPSDDTQMPRHNELDFNEPQFDEKAELQKNRAERLERAQQNIAKLRHQIIEKNPATNRIVFKNIGSAKPVLDWKLLLRREVEKTETVWSQRRSIAENNYAYRLEENDLEDEAETEVMIDSSYSISKDLVMAFLRQLRPILKNSKLKVGFFASEATRKFQEIKSDRDIDKIYVYRPGYSTNMDAAVRAFSKKQETNKIVFTDGFTSPGGMPKPDLKDVNVLWLVYRDHTFRPCCGKVFLVFEQDILKMINAEHIINGSERTL